jgi:hypothetical protein
MAHREDLEYVRETYPTKEYYHSGSPNLTTFLSNSGMFVLFSYNHPEKNNRIWVFNKGPRLQFLLNQWHDDNPNKRKGDVTDV